MSAVPDGVSQYGMFLVISTAGIPVAVSKLVAEQMAYGTGKEQ